MQAVPTIAFGPWSIALLLPALQAMFIAAALWRKPANRRANRYLAGLLITLCGLLTPYIIGYAGFYDVYRWLNFAPFAVHLAVGPLIWAHIHALTTGRAIDWRHWLLPLFHFGYQAAIFPLPVATKEAIGDSAFMYGFWIGIDIALTISLIYYGWRGWQQLKAYERWIAPRRVNLAPVKRLRPPLIALVALLLIWTGYGLTDRLIRDLNYFDNFPAYIALAILTVWLAVEGWRQADQPFPMMPGAADRDWPTLAQQWEAELRASDWWRDPELNLAGLARKLGTNTSHLSRGLNEGLGVSFPDLLATIRCNAIMTSLRQGDNRDLLTLAMEAGFGSKASFNRIFKGVTGATPSAWRVSNAKSSRELAN